MPVTAQERRAEVPREETVAPAAPGFLVSRDDGAVVLTHLGCRALAWCILSNPQQYPTFCSTPSLVTHHPLGVSVSSGVSSQLDDG